MEGEWLDRERMNHGQRMFDKTWESVGNRINNQCETAEKIGLLCYQSTKNKDHVGVEWYLENLNNLQQQKLILIKLQAINMRFLLWSY